MMLLGYGWCDGWNVLHDCNLLYCSRMASQWRAWWPSLSHRILTKNKMFEAHLMHWTVPSPCQHSDGMPFQALLLAFPMAGHSAQQQRVESYMVDPKVNHELQMVEALPFRENNEECEQQNHSCELQNNARNSRPIHSECFVHCFLHFDTCLSKIDSPIFLVSMQTHGFTERNDVWPLNPFPWLLLCWSWSCLELCSSLPYLTLKPGQQKCHAWGMHPPCKK